MRRAAFGIGLWHSVHEADAAAASAYSAIDTPSDDAHRRDLASATNKVRGADQRDAACWVVNDVAAAVEPAGAIRMKCRGRRRARRPTIGAADAAAGVHGAALAAVGFAAAIAQRRRRMNKPARPRSPAVDRKRLPAQRTRAPGNTEVPWRSSRLDAARPAGCEELTASVSLVKPDSHCRACQTREMPRAGSLDSTSTASSACPGVADALDRRAIHRARAPWAAGRVELAADWSEGGASGAAGRLVVPFVAAEGGPRSVTASMMMGVQAGSSMSRCAQAVAVPLLKAARFHEDREAGQPRSRHDPSIRELLQSPSTVTAPAARAHISAGTQGDGASLRASQVIDDDVLRT